MANNIKNGTLFSLFWENSKINKRNILTLAKRLDEDARTAKNVPQIFYPTEDLFLSRPRDNLSRLMCERKSSRSFSDVALSEKQLGSLFYAFAQRSKSTRLIPSAGGKYPIEVYAFLFNVRSKLNKKVVYYNADNHSLSVVAESCDWQKEQEFFGLNLDGVPAVFFVFVAIPERTIDKYGDRGGRFILIEVGHYAQNLALRLSLEKLGGVISGALRDDEVKRLLGLQNTNALITLGFACGNIKR
ncbi:MAG: SagB/ThcOx family dehydrogenase [Patescibacteria group bacterium]|nr:SagB/ThcOx family dehydrogenase [Patescibacteria group bacterium]